MSVDVLVCTDLVSGVCRSSVSWQSAYLIPPESGNATELFLTGGFSSEAAGYGFGGALTLFVAGLGIGFILKFLRKL
jgi:hypothetical protein